MSLIEREALLPPVPAGMKVTWIAQLVPAARVDPQPLLLMAKSPGFCPVRERLRIANCAVPVFVS